MMCNLGKMASKKTLNGPEYVAAGEHLTAANFNNFMSRSTGVGNLVVGYGIGLSNGSYAPPQISVPKTKTIDEMLDDCKDEDLDDDAPDESRCVVCMDRKRIVAPQCGHLVMCAKCTRDLNPKKCPTCREDITGIQRIFI